MIRTLLEKLLYGVKITNENLLVVNGKLDELMQIVASTEDRDCDNSEK